MYSYLTINLRLLYNCLLYNSSVPGSDIGSVKLFTMSLYTSLYNACTQDCFSYRIENIFLLRFSWSSSIAVLSLKSLSTLHFHYACKSYLLPIFMLSFVSRCFWWVAARVWIKSLVRILMKAPTCRRLFNIVSNQTHVRIQSACSVPDSHSITLGICSLDYTPAFTYVSLTKLYTEGLL